MAVPPLGSAGAAQQSVLDAMLAVTTGLSLPMVLHRVIAGACSLVDAQYGALGVLGEGNALAEFMTYGAPDDMADEIGHHPEGLGILGLLIDEPAPIRLRDLTQHPKSSGFPPGHVPMRSFLGVPIRLRDSVFGNLYLCEKRNAEEFTEDDEALAVSLAAVAAVAIDNARLHERLQDLAVIEDRERIARDLHDKVIQRLFATGMGLQGLTATLDKTAATRVGQAVDELDAVIAEIRTSIFELEARPATRPNLSAAVLDLVDRVVRDSEVEPTVVIEGPLHARVAPDLGEDLLATSRELLTNVVRHAHAQRVEVRIDVTDDLVLEVRDDGVGISPAGEFRRGHGIANAAARARARGGHATVTPHPDGGTMATWQVPLV
ncbi:MAG: GAF domain-containing protein [Acidimicrobiia bacterium]|nr:GAF domain-containing protein [Acidimicrobiia bacterium]